MTVLLDTLPSSTEGALRGLNCITVGLVNNMPDAALASTERQFTALMRAASSRVVVRLLLFSIPEIPRGEEGRREVSQRYRNISELWDSRVDGLIVTGTEPRAENLKDEPYWSALSQVVDWTYDNTTAAIWSCLGAHAAVLRSSGIERQPSAEKVHGIFDCEAAYLHPMTVDTARGFRVPHSRYNGLPEDALTESGYRVLTRSSVAGVDMFAKQEKSFHLFLQGHPEYEALTLLREYRRDICRYLNREREIIPVSILEKPPSAELRPDQKDTDSLPPYDVLDPILEAYVERYETPEAIAAANNIDLELVRKVVRLVERSEYKRQQAAPVLKVTTKAFGMGRRFPIAVKVQV